MKTIKENINFDCDAKELWSILSDVSRCDWVPSVNKIILEDDCRVFEMEGIGEVKEKILLNDSKRMILKYSAIQTIAPLNHHLAIMNVIYVNKDHCKLEWTTEIDPDIFADAIHQGMISSIKGIKEVIKQ
tara:strand:- start:677 stop:1066 length:390 start_codon:yes stop_codon:yes gene_type:complete